MTFVEAAIEILKRERRPLSSRELAERAVKHGLLSVVGRDPEATMQQRLDDALAGQARHPDLVRTHADTFGLRVYPPPPEPAPASASGAGPERPTAEADEAPTEKRRRRRRRGGGGDGAARASESNESAESAETSVALTAEGASTESAPQPGAAPEKRRRRRRGGRGRRGGEAVVPAEDGDAGAATEGEVVAVAEVAEPGAVEPAEAEPASSLEPEQELLNVESEELEGEPELESDLDGHQGPVLAPAAGAEDITRTDDDRTVRPEILGRSDDRRRERDRDRKKRHKGPKHERKSQGQSPEGKAHEPKSQDSKPTEQRPQAKSQDVKPAEGRERGVLDVVVEILRGSDGRPMHVRHLVDLARKQHLLDEHAPAGDQVRLARIAVLRHARERQAEGLRPRVRVLAGHVALVDRKLDGELVQAERELQERVRKVRDTARVVVRRRVARIAPPAFEALGRVLAERLGIANLALVRRGEGVSYWGGERQKGVSSVRSLLALRPGEGEVSRRAVGELRAGLAAKGFDEGFLFAAGRPNDEALAELKQGGVTLYDGAALAALLVEHGLGVRRTALVVDYLDLDFWSELTES
jgi:hypothetical protein